LEDAKLEKVECIAEILAMCVMITPALAIDGEVVLTGKIPSQEELHNLLRNT
jgi:hypothetical protein